MSNIRLSADIGGTFTDLVLDVRNVRYTRKVLTTPKQPELGLLEGVELILKDASIEFSAIDIFIHGTTLATNAIIERRGARTALIATEGFRDVLEIGTESRYDQYDLKLEKPIPLVPRDLRFTIRERMDARGNVFIPLDKDQVAGLARTLKENQVRSVAIAFMHGYANPRHEQAVAEILSRELPDLTITLASDVCPEVREYERTSTAVANAYVQPIMAGYLSRMSAALSARSFRGSLYLVTSGGGLTSLETASKYPVRLVESGPAGGAIFASEIALGSRESNVLSFDMGGTTAKICLIKNGEPATSRFFEVDRMARFLKGSGLPLRIPVIEMVEIGAGGGSIARVDTMQRVVVGPESAASDPGPACYNRGGDKPAVTDANATLGLIDPVGFSGGSFDLRVDLSKKALLEAVGNKLEMSAELSAYAVYEIVCENMASAARVHAAELGANLGDHTMIAFGGGAPLHAARVAEKTGIGRIIVPINAGVGSAVGFLKAPISYEVIRSHAARIDETFDVDSISDTLDEMAVQAKAIVEPGAKGQPLFERRVGYMRYVGQGHEIAVELPSERLSKTDTRQLRDIFEREYASQFARVIPNAAIEVMTWSVLVSTEAAKIEAKEQPSSRTQAKPHGKRSFFDGAKNDVVEVDVYRRSDLGVGAAFAGPCFVTESETTTYVSAGFDAFVDANSSIVMTRKA